MEDAVQELRGKTILGRFSHAPVYGIVETWDEALITVGDDGIIEERVLGSESVFQERRDEAERRGNLVQMPSNSWILPGFVDLHVHAPQYPQLGSALDLPLERWLEHYTFPLEARFEDLNYAQEVYSTLIDDMLASGTTTAMLFATIHQEATRALVDICLNRGMRALVGKVVADDETQTPSNYRDHSREEAIQGTESLINYIHDHPANSTQLVKPVVTPRFVPSCTEGTLRQLGEIATHYDCHIQTHCSESDWHVGHVQNRTGVRDAEYLDSMNLLTDKTVLAHSVFLNEADMDLVGNRNSSIAHCPLSNAYFADAVFPVREALRRNIRVGLGTDISGGPSLFMLDALRDSVLVSRMLESGLNASLPPERRGRPDSEQSWREGFYLATTGGAEALGLNVGVFKPGYAFDAQLIDTATSEGTIRTFGDTSSSDAVLGKILYTATPPNVSEVWVAGKSVTSRR